jgi:hypothetical protein
MCVLRGIFQLLLFFHQREQQVKLFPVLASMRGPDMRDFYFFSLLIVGKSGHGLGAIIDFFG